MAIQTVSGSVSYRERIALPPDATINVEIAYQPPDSDRPVAIGYQGFQSAGNQVPFSFSVPYDDEEIDGRRNYFVQATINHPAQRFCFGTAEPPLVITRGRPTSDVGVLLGQASSNRQSAVVTGTVTHRERSSLPPDSVLTVRLVDVSRADAPAMILGEQSYSTAGRQVPLPFIINYDPAQVDARFSYSVAARINDAAGTLRFISDTHNPVITRGSPTHNVEVVIRRV